MTKAEEAESSSSRGGRRVIDGLEQRFEYKVRTRKLWNMKTTLSQSSSVYDACYNVV